METDLYSRLLTVTQKRSSGDWQSINYGQQKKEREHQAGFRDVLLVLSFSLRLFTLHALGCLLANSKDCCSCSARRAIINEMHLCPSIGTRLKRDFSSVGTGTKGSLLMLFSCQEQPNPVTQRTGPSASWSRPCGRKGLWSDRCLHRHQTRSWPSHWRRSQSRMGILEYMDVISFIISRMVTSSANEDADECCLIDD